MAKKSAEQKGEGRSILPIKPGMTFVNIGMAVGLAVLLTIIMKTLAPILKPFFIALFLSYLLYPIIEYLVKKKVPKFFAYLLVFVLIFGLFYVLGAIITVQVNEFIDNLDIYKARFADILTQFTAFLQKYSILERFGFDSDLIDFREFSPLEKLQELILSKFDLSKITGYIGSSLGSFLDVVVNILVVVFFYALVTPMGLAMRAVGRRPLSTAPDPRMATYWTRRAHPSRPRQDYERQH